MFGRLVDMATRTLIIDLSKGTGGEPMYGIVTVQRTRATSEGTFEVLPWETKLKLHNGIATITEAVTDGSGPFYDSAYLIRVQNGYCAPRWGFMAALPDGTTPITTGDMPKVNPITGEGIYMDAQEWNALYGTLPSRLSLLDGQGQRGYIVKQQAGRTVSVWDYLNNREQLIYGDTGVRKLTPNALFTDSGQEVTVSREGKTVSVTGWRLAATSAPTGDVVVVSLPSGFRPHNLSRLADMTFRGRPLSVASNGDLIINAPVAPVDHFNITFRTNDPWPTTLPGV